MYAHYLNGEVSGFITVHMRVSGGVGNGEILSVATIRHAQLQ